MELLLTVVDDVPLCGVVDESEVGFVVDDMGILEEPEMELERGLLEVELELMIELEVREPGETRLEIADDELDAEELVEVNNVEDEALVAFAFRS